MRAVTTVMTTSAPPQYQMLGEMGDDIFDAVLAAPLERESTSLDADDDEDRRRAEQAAATAAAQRKSQTRLRAVTKVMASDEPPPVPRSLETSEKGASDDERDAFEPIIIDDDVVEPR